MASVQALLNLQTFVFYGLFFLSGLLLKFLPPKMNKWYGYRSRKAMGSPQIWSYAQNVAANYILIVSVVLMLVSLLINYFSDYNYSALGLYSIINVLLLILGTVMIYFLTDDKVKKYIKKNHL